MDTWLHLIHVDGQLRYRWYMLNSYGELITISVKFFDTEDETKSDLEAYLAWAGRGDAA